MSRTILHSDCNCFYASVELLHHPELRGKPVAVGGDPEARHGIVLTADYTAKRCGVKTGMALWQAKQICPDITFLPPRMDLYLRFSRMAQEIYAEYTDQREPYGIDESWLDVTDSVSIKGDGYQIAQEISSRMKKELGITVSVGVSFNKIFAKLGSDYKKPDAITTMNKDEYKEKAWPLPVSDLLYVGSATNRKLKSMGIHTIGDLAETDERFLNRRLGKMGNILWAFANGYDDSPVKLENTSAPIKSVGNSTTTPRDMETEVYGHILDEDRKKNAQMMERAFYNKENLNPDMHGQAGAVPNNSISVPGGIDAELLAKVLENPEMIALFTSLAKTMKIS